MPPGPPGGALAMRLEPFLLDRWLEQKHDPRVDVRWDLGSSTGPVWTLATLAKLLDADLVAGLCETKLGYTPTGGTPEARAAIAAYEGVEAEQVLLTTGASEGILAVLLRAAAPGANVLVPSPGYPAFASIAHGLGLEVRAYELRPERGWALDVAEVEALVDRRTALVLVNSPHNPTGAVVEPDTIGELAELCAAHGGHLVCDQVYHPIYHDGGRPSAAGRSGVTVLGDASKALCLGGLRIGWIVEPDGRRRADYAETRATLTIANAALAQRLLAEVLPRAERLLDAGRRAARANLELLDGFLERHAERLAWTRPRGGFTGLVQVRGAADATPLCRALLGRGVLVAPGAYLGGPADGFRLGFGVEPDFAGGLRAMAEGLEAWSDGPSGADGAREGRR